MKKSKKEINLEEIEEEEKKEDKKDVKKIAGDDLSSITTFKN